MFRLILAFLAAIQSPAQQVTVLPAEQAGIRAGQTATAATPSEAQQFGGVEGTVLNALTGEPLRKAQVTLIQAGPGAQAPLATSSGVDGRFMLTGVPAGRYRLMAERIGFVRGAYGSRGASRNGAPISIAGGQNITSLVVRLTPQGVLTGRVLDEDGEPVLSAQVQALRYAYLQGQRRLVPVSNDSTNDLGEFRLHSLEPGKYYLMASHGMRGRWSFGSRARTPAEAEESYAPTYYPGATDPASAVALEIAPGNILRDLDIRLMKTPTFRISGRVINPSSANRPQRPAQISLLPRSPGGVWFGRRNMTTARPPDGRFEMLGVSPGSYLLSATCWEDNKTFFARLPVEITNSNLEGLLLTAAPAVQVSGAIRADSGSPVQFNRVEIMFQPRDMHPSAGVAGVRIKPDGALSIPYLLPDVYNLGRVQLPDDYYVKSMRFGDQDVLESGLNLAGGAAGSLDVVVSPNGAQVSGTVLSEKGEPAPGATVALVPEAARRRQSHLFKSAITDQYGSFTLRGIAPGGYLLFAWQEVESGAWQDPEFLRTVEDSGQSISLREGSRETKQLKVLPSAAQAR